MGYTQHMSILYEIMYGLGGILIMLGVVIVLLTPSEAHISISMIISGIIIILVARKEGYSWKKGVEGEKVISKILSFLPDDEYKRYDDLKFSNYGGNIDHLVIGKNNIFVIETKNYTGQYIIEGETWYKKTKNGNKIISHNPGKQIKTSVLKFKEFLRSKGIRKRIWIEAIVVMVNKNAKIHKEPKGYVVLMPVELVNYIKTRKGSIDTKTLKDIDKIISKLKK